MAQTTWSDRVDMDVKRQLDAQGADVAASDPFYAESNRRHLQRSIQQLAEGKVVIKTMEELEEMANG